MFIHLDIVSMLYGRTNGWTGAKQYRVLCAIHADGRAIFLKPSTQRLYQRTRNTNIVIQIPPIPIAEINMQ